MTTFVGGDFSTREGIDYRASCEFTTLTKGRARFSFLGRGGGVSPIPYNSLNMSFAVGDEAENVKDNYERMQAVFGMRSVRPITAKQVHGTGVFIAGDGPPPAGVEADAIITDTPGLPIGVLTADCLPILLFDPVKKSAAAVHAGWRGTVKGVAMEAVFQMKHEFSSDAADICVVFGPYIAPCCYRVGAEVVDAYRKDFGSAPNRFVYGNDGGKDGGNDGGKDGGEDRGNDGGKNEGEDGGEDKYWFDLARANREVLKSAGVKDEKMVFDFACTSCENSRLFSHRKDNGLTGRQLSFIMITG